ncbi:hypothetical protein PCANC_16734 [Puccinia coronata f. sp. avenae]|uniref:Uncharacterized protein n=1 Tax=Puccinia coronata f. sp. avenae TaxID=200324 RepID=A0A2N5SKX2_9BASI|nr:hypothetical protein PCANC_16734 [Puccinia coronata f. sp. avenae]
MTQLEATCSSFIMAKTQFSQSTGYLGTLIRVPFGTLIRVPNGTLIRVPNGTLIRVPRYPYKGTQGTLMRVPGTLIRVPSTLIRVPRYPYEGTGYPVPL